MCRKRFEAIKLDLPKYSCQITHSFQVHAPLLPVLLFGFVFSITALCEISGDASSNVKMVGRWKT